MCVSVCERQTDSSGVCGSLQSEAAGVSSAAA